METPKFKKTVKKFLDDLIYFLVLYMQITEEQVSLLLLGLKLVQNFIDQFKPHIN